MNDSILSLIKPPFKNPQLSRPDWTIDTSRDESLLWLNKNENPDLILNEKIQELISKVQKYAINTYPETAKIYKKLSLKHDLSPKNFLLTNGSDGAIRSVFELLIGPGDKVLHTVPTFAMYDVYSKIFGAEQISINYQSSPQGPLIDENKFLDLVATHRPKLVCLANPDSPTGTIFSVEKLRQLIDLTEQQNSALLVDEAYFPFYKETVIPYVQNYSHIFVARSFSKAWGCAGVRVGYLVGNEMIMEFFHKNRSMYEVGTLSSELIYHLLDYESEILKSVKRLEDGRDYFTKEMAALNFLVTKSYGNFLHVNFQDKESKIANALKSKVIYRRQSCPEECLKGYSRFSLATVEQFTEIVAEIKRSSV